MAGHYLHPLRLIAHAHGPDKPLDRYAVLASPCTPRRWAACPSVAKHRTCESDRTTSLTAHRSRDSCARDVPTWAWPVSRPVPGLTFSLQAHRSRASLRPRCTYMALASLSTGSRSHLFPAGSSLTRILRPRCTYIPVGKNGQSLRLPVGYSYQRLTVAD
jgi:hypothetical protein